jgi:hypothetical protein
LEYGYYSFKLEILEYCEPNVLIKREQYYLDNLKPEYNVLKKAGSMLGFRHSESTKKLFRITRLGSPCSEITRLKLSVNNHKSIPVILTNIKTRNIIKFSSIRKAAQFLDVSVTSVRKFIKLDKSYKGYTIIIE